MLAGHREGCADDVGAGDSALWLDAGLVEGYLVDPLDSTGPESDVDGDCLSHEPFVSQILHCEVESLRAYGFSAARMTIRSHTATGIEPLFASISAFSAALSRVPTT